MTIDNVWPVVGAARSNIMAVREGFSQTVFTVEAKQKKLPSPAL
jgi:hypothetical protein